MAEPQRQIITRKAAKEKGLKRYFTGKPCKHGHICERQTSDGKCVECNRLRVRDYYEKFPEKKKEVNRRAWSKLSPDYKKAKAQRYRTNNREVWLQSMRNHYQGNKAAYKQRRAQILMELQEEYDQLSSEDQQRVDAIYKEMSDLNEKFGPDSYHVDHIIPRSKGGKHHPDNLRVITAYENRSKGATYESGVDDISEVDI